MMGVWVFCQCTGELSDKGLLAPEFDRCDLMQIND